MPVSTRSRRRFSFCEPSGEKALLDSNPIALFGCNVEEVQPYGGSHRDMGTPVFR